MILTSGKLLRDHRTPQEELEEGFREFVVEMLVVTGGPLDGLSVEEGGLRHLKGVYLAALERPNGDVRVAESGTRLAGGDRLRFVGKADEVLDLLSMPGLASAHADQIDGFDLVRSDFFEAVIGPSSSLVGTTLKEARFRTAFLGAVVAIHRAGHRIDAKLGEVPLRTADTLVILADSGFLERHRDRSDFLLVSPLGAPTVTDTRHRLTVMIVGFAVLFLAGSGLLPILDTALLAAITLVALGVLTFGQARDAVDLNVVVMVAASFGLAAAMEVSGLAAEIAALVVDGLGPLGSIGVLTGVILTTTLLTELVSNAAAASVVFPIAFVTAQSLGMDPHALAIAVAVGASSSFLTPIGYQTNMMVYGPGGYRYFDYIRLGAPLTVAMLVVSVTLIHTFML
jgi:di/tricarboxylate transporter